LRHRTVQIGDVDSRAAFILSTSAGATRSISRRQDAWTRLHEALRSASPSTRRQRRTPRFVPSSLFWTAWNGAGGGAFGRV